MILIADSGTSKTNWCLLNGKNEKLYFDTEGYNPYFVDTGYITKSLQKSLPGDIDHYRITELYYYGAGCFPGRDYILSDSLKGFFKNAQIFIELDLLAAARALLGKSTGFAAILGTGMNTCIYDGRQITLNIDSLGYILGDEGSATAIGKKLLADYIRESMPADISQLFHEKFHLDKEAIFDRLYGKPYGNIFCAEFSRFVGENINHEYFNNLVKNSFRELFQNMVTKYEGYQNYSFNCVGTVGFIFKDILKDVAAEFNMQTGKIIKAPIDGLVEYHLSD